MFKAGSTWVVKKGNPGKIDTSDLCGLKIAVQTGTTQEEEVNKGAEQCKADNKLDIQILSNKLQTDVTTNVVTGKADVFYADSPVAGYAISQTDDQLEAFGEDVGVTKEAVAIKKGDSDTAKAVQAAMQKLMDDGTYMKILKHWASNPAPSTRPRSTRPIWADRRTDAAGVGASDVYRSMPYAFCRLTSA